jgi:hypothetical protein
VVIRSSCDGTLFLTTTVFSNLDDDDGIVVRVKSREKIVPWMDLKPTLFLQPADLHAAKEKGPRFPSALCVLP